MKYEWMYSVNLLHKKKNILYNSTLDAFSQRLRQLSATSFPSTTLDETYKKVIFIWKDVEKSLKSTFTTAKKIYYMKELYAFITRIINSSSSGMTFFISSGLTFWFERFIHVFHPRKGDFTWSGVYAMGVGPYLVSVKVCRGSGVLCDGGGTLPGQCHGRPREWSFMRWGRDFTWSRSAAGE